MPGKSETFRKSERLCSKKAIEALFENGKSFYCDPLMVVWSFSETELSPPAQVAFSVPKKIFKLAVTRNLIRRRMREAYRKNKAHLYDHLNCSGKKIVFTIIYRDKSVSDYVKTEIAVRQMIKYFIRTVGAS